MDLDPTKETKEEKQKFFSKGYLIGLAISTAGAIVLGALIFVIRYFSGMLGDNRVFVCLTDAFSLSGFLSIMFFFIVWVSNYGAFDAISYSVQLAFLTIFHRNVRQTRLPATYRDYRELKRGKKRANTTFMLFPGLLFLIVGIILIIVYNVK